MLRVFLKFTMVSAFFFTRAIPAEACGDKLLVLGRGIRFQLGFAAEPATILLYRQPGSPGLAGLSDPKLQSALREAGHKLYSAESREELEQSLQEGTYDVVLADLADAPGVEQVVQSTGAKAVVLPLVYQGTKAEANQAKKQYSAVLKAPGRTGHYCDSVDKAMKLKSKREQSKGIQGK